MLKDIEINFSLQWNFVKNMYENDFIYIICYNFLTKFKIYNIY